MTYGNIINRLMENSTKPKPEVGMGVTECCWSDRHPYTIVEVVSDRELVIQADDYKRTDDNGMSECQSYEFTPNPDAPKVTILFRKTKNHPSGKWVRKGDSIKGNGYSIGRRERYWDPSF